MGCFFLALLLVQVLMDIFRSCSRIRSSAWAPIWRHLMSKSLQAFVQHTNFSKSYNLHGASYQVDADTGGSEIIPGTPRLPCLVLFHPKQVVPPEQIWMHFLKCFKICILQLIDYLLYHLQNTWSVVCSVHNIFIFSECSSFEIRFEAGLVLIRTF